MQTVQVVHKQEQPIKPQPLKLHVSTLIKSKQILIYVHMTTKNAAADRGILHASALCRRKIWKEGEMSAGIDLPDWWWWLSRLLSLSTRCSQAQQWSHIKLVPTHKRTEKHTRLTAHFYDWRTRTYITLAHICTRACSNTPQYAKSWGAGLGETGQTSSSWHIMLTPNQVPVYQPKTRPEPSRYLVQFNTSACSYSNPHPLICPCPQPRGRTHKQKQATERENKVKPFLNMTLLFTAHFTAHFWPTRSFIFINLTI